jgi:hypothetical protein
MGNKSQFKTSVFKLLNRWPHYHEHVKYNLLYLQAEATQSRILNSDLSTPESCHCLLDKGHSFLLSVPGTFVCDPHASYTYIRQDRIFKKKCYNKEIQQVILKPMFHSWVMILSSKDLICLSVF